MRISGIISEYNPFHRGHKHHIDETRSMLGEDCGIVCAMSGNFVQRGEAAAFLKSARAEAALRCGADLVLELPLPWALSSAEGFARGAAALLDATGIVSHLSFGSESGNVRELDKAAALLLRPEMDGLIREKLSGGISYAKARQAAADALAGRTVTELSTPNNLLGIEYIKTLRSRGLSMKPVTVKRAGAGHDEMGDSPQPSASQLRSLLAAGENISANIPAEAAAVFSRETEKGRGPVVGSALDTAIVSRLRMLPPEAFATLPDAAEGLDQRLYRACREGCSVEETVSLAATKRYAMSRLRRMIMCAAIGVTAEDAMGTPPYIRVLAANGKGREMLKMMQRAAKLPVVTKPGEINSLDGRSKRVFDLECAASDLFVLGFSAPEERKCGREWRTSPFIMK